MGWLRASCSEGGLLAPAAECAKLRLARTTIRESAISVSSSRDCGGPPVPGTHIASTQRDVRSQPTSLWEMYDKEVKSVLKDTVVPPAALRAASSERRAWTAAPSCLMICTRSTWPPGVSFLSDIEQPRPGAIICRASESWHVYTVLNDRGLRMREAWMLVSPCPGSSQVLRQREQSPRFKRVHGDASLPLNAGCGHTAAGCRVLGSQCLS